MKCDFSKARLVYDGMSAALDNEITQHCCLWQMWLPFDISGCQLSFYPNLDQMSQIPKWRHVGRPGSAILDDIIPPAAEYPIIW